MRISRTYGVRTLAAAGLIGAAMLTPAVASAATASPAASPMTPSNCTRWTADQYGYGQCLSGTGQYRVHGRCVKVDDPTQYYTVNGAWVSVPKKSEFGCPTATYPEPLSIQKR